MTFPSPPSPGMGPNGSLPTQPSAGPTGPPAVPPSPLWPDPTPEPPSSKREGLLLGGAVLLAALLVLGGLFAWNRSRSSEIDAVSPTENSAASDPSSAPSSEAPQAPSPSTEPPTNDSATDDPDSPPTTESPAVAHAECPAGVPTQVCDAAEFVEDFRGKPFKEFPTVELVDEEAFAERLLRDFDDTREDIDISTEVWRSLGFIESDVDLADVIRSFNGVGVVGVYFPDTSELYVQGSDLNLYSELVILHELVHAHDDQWLDLNRDYEDAEDEISYGFRAVAEGNARRVENAWRAGLSSEQEEALAELEIGLFSPEEIEIYLSIPQIFLQLQLSPYQDGLSLVEAIARSGGEEAVNDALVDPPTTSEQVLHPELFAAQEPAIAVAPPPAEGEIIDDGLVGELAFDLWFGDAVGDGWGGDSYVTWATASGACTRVDVVGDTEADTNEFFDAADTWSRQAEGRSVERSDENIRITGCY